MPDIKFDFNNMFASSVGDEHGVTELELQEMQGPAQKAHRRLESLLDSPASRVDLGLEWAVLPYQDAKAVRQTQKLADSISHKYENVLFLGIGGSYLGLKAAQDALCPPYYNEFKKLRKGRAKVYFEGNNLDPAPLAALLKNLAPKKTFVVVISKSGETTETKAAFEVVENWLKYGAGKRYGRQVLAVTDPVSGSLRRRVEEEQKRDPLSFRSLPLLRGVGGRYSEFNMGLLHLGVAGVDIAEVLSGSRDMARRCRSADLYKNPAALYAVLQFLASKNKGKSIAILMPFAESLKSTADWYCQLLAESLGKKYERKIKAGAKGGEAWEQDLAAVAHAGRTPVPARGTTDLHSIQQNNVEGVNNKTVTMIRVEEFARDMRVPASKGLLSKKSFSELLNLAQEATEWALVRANRPNCTIAMPEVSPLHWGGLLYFFEMATAFEGELLNVNAFDQPGVESYKHYMYYKLGRAGTPEVIAEEIRKHPLKKERKFIL